MFGNNMMKQLQQMKEQMEEIKARLDAITVVGEAYEGKIKVTMTGNRKVVDIHIDPSLTQNVEELQEMLVIAHNRALEKAENVNESEMQGAAKGMMPGMF